ncbi:MAG: phage integrase SAM-like domain-containing protein [Treponema sp.]|nr:phage integrase SAM-like domain-containing protein [Treponema sp.]
MTYLAEFSAHYASPGIVGNCIYHVKKFRNGETILISQIDGRWLEGFQDYLLRDAEVCQNSVNNYEKTLRAALRKAVAEPHYNA